MTEYVRNYEENLLDYLEQNLKKLHEYKLKDLYTYKTTLLYQGSKADKFKGCVVLVCLSVISTI